MGDYYIRNSLLSGKNNFYPLEPSISVIVAEQFRLSIFCR